MRYIKEFVELDRGGYRCIVRSNTYTKTLQHMIDLFNIAQQDYEELQYEDIDVIKYGGDRYKRTFGIEFNVDFEPSKTWEQRARVEFEL